MEVDRDSVARFDDRAADYVRFRPSYPPEAIDAILSGLAPATLTAADVGAGTGISARLLADRGVRVIAIEPGARMRGAAQAHPRVAWLAAKAEALALADESVGLVLSAQSFHWFRPVEALPEFARVLAPAGRLAIVWNRRSRTDPLTAGFRQAILDVGGESQAEQMPFDPGVVAASGRFQRLERVSFPMRQRLDREGLIGRARSASYVPKSGPEGERLIARLSDLHARFADAQGIVSLVYETEIFLAVSTPT